MRILALVLSLVAAFPAWAQMYKCVDERGVTHYTDQPRPGCKGGKVEIQARPPISGSFKPPAPAEGLARQDAEFRRRQIEREQIEASDKSALGERCARLLKLKEELRTCP